MIAAALLPDTLPEMPAVGTAPAPLTVRSFGLTNRGWVRPSNEDHFLIAELACTLWVRHSSLPQPGTQYSLNRAHILLVADGVGGNEAGEVASALTVETIEALVLHLLRRLSNLQATDEQTVLQDFQTALRHADFRLCEESAYHPEWARMGTTLTLAFISGRKLFVVHAGDGRYCLFGAGKLRALAVDHTMAAETARRGVIRPDQVRSHPWRHVVTNVLGGGDVGVQIDVRRADLEPDDVAPVCTDGLTDMLYDDQMAAILAAERSPEAACRRLVEEANRRGGQDNITCIVARMEDA